MRHHKQGKKLNRNTHQRKALFRGLISSLFLHEEIKTTESKAKAIRSLAEKLISRAKTGTLSVRRQIQAFLINRKVTNKLVDEIAPRFKQKTSGFIKFIKLYSRLGDNATMVKMELTEKKEKVKEVKTKADNKKATQKR